MELVSNVHQHSPFYFEFQPLQKKITAPLLTLEDVNIGYDKKTVLSNINININAGDRIGLLGANGAGKSTLIKCFAGVLEAQQGDIHRHKALTIGYFAQHLIEQLDLNQTPLERLQQLPQLQSAMSLQQQLSQYTQPPPVSEQKLRSFLGSFGFNKDMISMPLHNFSGGEKARFVLSTIVWQTPNLLLLDEPTNHLDLEMRSALTFALQEYQGAVVLVSHDRYLLKTTTDDLYLINDGQVNVFDGDVDDYAEWVIEEQKTQKRQKSLSNADKSSKTIAQPMQQQDHKQKNKNLPGKIKKLEEQLKRLCDTREEIDRQLANNKIYQPENQQQLNKLLEKREKLNQEITGVELAWLELSEGS